jgi:hypothetical protein
MGDLAVTYQMSNSTPDANGPGATNSAGSTPVVTDANGDIIVAAPPEGPTRIGLAGLDVTTGRQEWVAPGDQAAVTPSGVVAWQYGPPPAAPPAGDSIPFTHSTVTGLDPANGTPRWTTQAVVGAVANDIALLFPNNSTLEAVGVTDGQPRWHQPWPAEAVPSSGQLRAQCLQQRRRRALPTRSPRPAFRPGAATRSSDCRAGPRSQQVGSYKIDPRRALPDPG